MARKWAKVNPFYDIMNLVLHSNYDIYMLFIYSFIYYENHTKVHNEIKEQQKIYKKICAEAMKQINTQE